MVYLLPQLVTYRVQLDREIRLSPISRCHNNLAYILKFQA